MRRADIIAGFILLITGVVTLLIILPAEVSGHSDYGLAPDFFPRFLMWLFVMFSALLVVNRLALVTKGEPDADPAPPLVRADILFITGMSIYLAAVHFAMSRFGFIPAGIFAVAVAGALLGELRTNPLRLALVSAIAPTVVLYLFRTVFLVYLP
jgi:hypothetical protein